jgi:hypothetical protein
MTRNIKYTEVNWWIWAVVAGCLLWGLTGELLARHLAMAISATFAVIYLSRHGNVRHFPTQVRVAYALWMAASFVPELTFMYWIQTAGTTALITLGYCPLARLLLIFPWNRTVPLTWRRLFIIAFHPPVAGSVLTGLPL